MADDLRRQIAIEHGEIAVAVEGFGTLEPPQPGGRDVDSPHNVSIEEGRPGSGRRDRHRDRRPSMHPIPASLRLA